MFVRSVKEIIYMNLILTQIEDFNTNKNTIHFLRVQLPQRKSFLFKHLKGFHSLSHSVYPL